MSGQIDWQNTSSEQRDRLIHEKIMGKPLDVPCTQEHSLIDGEYWRCACGWMSADLEHTDHAQQIPAYSTSMSDAWQVVEKIREGGRNNPLFAQWQYRLDYLYGRPSHRDVLYDLNPEAICLAALQAVGVL